MSGLVVVSSQLPRSAVALTVEKDPPREPVSEVAYVRNLLIRDPTGLPLTARYIPSESPSPPVTDMSLTTAMPPSDLRRDCQVNSGTLPHFEAAVVDLRRQRETTAKLVKQLLERLSPPQAENAKVPVQRSDQFPITIPAPPFAPSAPFTSSKPVSVNRLALSTSLTRSDSPNSSIPPSEAFASSAGTEEPPLPDFDGDRFTGRDFYNNCRFHLRSHPKTFGDDSAKIRFVMSHMVSGRAGRWANRELGVDRNGALRFATWSDFAAEFRKFFMHPRVEDEAINVIETDHYFQGSKETVPEYLERFRNLIDDSSYTDPRYIVVKFRRGLNHQVSIALSTSATPSLADPEAWFSLAIQADTSFIAEEVPQIPSQPAVTPKDSEAPIGSEASKASDVSRDSDAHFEELRTTFLIPAASLCVSMPSQQAPPSPPVSINETVLVSVNLLDETVDTTPVTLPDSVTEEPTSPTSVPVSTETPCPPSDENSEDTRAHSDEGFNVGPDVLSSSDNQSGELKEVPRYSEPIPVPTNFETPRARSEDVRSHSDFSQTCFEVLSRSDTEHETASVAKVMIPRRLTKPVPKGFLDVGTAIHLTEDARFPLDVCSVDISQLRSKFSPGDDPTVRFPPSCDVPSIPLTFSPVIEMSYSNDFANAETLHIPPSDSQTCFDPVHDIPTVVRVAVPRVTASVEVTRLFPSDCHSPGTTEHCVETNNTHPDVQSKETLRDEPSPGDTPVVRIPSPTDTPSTLVDPSPIIRTSSGMPSPLHDDRSPTPKRDVVKDISKLREFISNERWRFRQPEWARRLRPRKPGTSTSSMPRKGSN